jgi:hypothetical protein
METGSGGDDLCEVQDGYSDDTTVAFKDVGTLTQIRNEVAMIALSACIPAWCPILSANRACPFLTDQNMAQNKIKRQWPPTKRK